MAYLKLKNKIESIETLGSIEEVLLLIEDMFCLKMFNLYREKLISKSDIDNVISETGHITIKTVRDPIFYNTEMFISLCELIINSYLIFLNNFLQSQKLNYNKKKILLSNSLYNLNKFAQDHNLNNRFAFAARSVFYLACEDGFKKMRIDVLNLSDNQKIEMKDWFTIRYELFSELTNITINKIEELEYEKFKYSGVKMNQENGPKLLMEFIMALSINKTYANIRKRDKEFLEKNLFEFFGVELLDGIGLRINISKRKKNKAVALQELVDSLNTSETHTKKRRTPSITS